MVTQYQKFSKILCLIKKIKWCCSEILFPVVKNCPIVCMITKCVWLIKIFLHSKNNHNSDFFPVRFVAIIVILLIVITFVITKLSRPGDSKGSFSAFESSCHLPTMRSTKHDGGFTLSIFLLNVKQGSCKYQYGLTRPEIEPESIVSVSTQPVIA